MLFVEFKHILGHISVDLVILSILLYVHCHTFVYMFIKGQITQPSKHVIAGYLSNDPLLSTECMMSLHTVYRLPVKTYNDIRITYKLQWCSFGHDYNDNAYT